MRALAGAGVLTSVRWIRSHPEGRLAHAAWTRDDVANHLADRWASKAHELPPATEGYLTPDAWDLAYKGDAITGPLRRSLKAILMTRHLRAGIVKSGRAEDAENMDWTLVLRGVNAARKEGLPALVWWTKLLGNILATETVLAKRGHGSPDQAEAATCKLCGAAAESSWHMIAECTGCPQVMACREKMIGKVHAALAEHLTVNSEVLLALQEMWKVDGDGRLRSWLAVGEADDDYANGLSAGTGGDANIYAAHIERMRCMQQVMCAQNSVESAALGCLGKGWRRLIKMEGELRAGKSLQLLTDLQVAMRRGVRDVWLCRNKERQKIIVANRQTIWHRRDATLEKLLQRYKRRGEDAPDGMVRHVLNLKGSKLRRWLTRHECDQHCVTEFFRREPMPDDLRMQRKLRHARITTAALSRPQVKSATQLLLVGNLATGEAGGTGTLSFSRHIPAHALTGETAAGPVASSLHAPPGCGTKRPSARRTATQLRIAPADSGLTLAHPPPLLLGTKRRRGSAAAGLSIASKKQRRPGDAAAALRPRKRAEMYTSALETAGKGNPKRKHGRAKHGTSPLKQAAQGQKRKGMAGFKPLRDDQLAHCDSSNSTCVTHRAGGSLQVGGKNTAGLLGKTVMRPLD